MLKNFTTLIFCCIGYLSFSQQASSSKMFLISSNSAFPISYNQISTIDLHAGKPADNIYDPKKRYSFRTNGFRSYYAMQKNVFTDVIPSPTAEDTLRTPMGGAVASMAFDAKNNRLYYVPQYLSELRYMDLNQAEPSFTYLESQSLNLLHNPYDVANQISRMTIGADGFGYAITNDGEHLIKFSTDSTPIIQDLGVLVDKPTNSVFIRSSCTSWGGDIVSDANNNLFLVTQFNHVFKISLPSKVSEYVGAISGLPGNFNTNGAAVDENGDLILSCGSSLDKGLPAFYKITNWTGLQATAIPGDNAKGLGNISDMASSNLLFQKAAVPAPIVTKADDAAKKQLPVFTIYPNPVSHGKFTIKTTNITDKGDYTMVLVDQTGRGVMQAKMQLGLKSNTNSFTFPSQEAKGVYMVLIMDIFNRTIYSQQLIVE